MRCSTQYGVRASRAGSGGSQRSPGAMWSPTGAGSESRLDETVALPLDEARRRLAAVPGVGPWTVAEVAAVAFGDADAVSVGDYHLRHQVVCAFTGRARGSDTEMLELLAPFAGHRGRVARLVARGGPTPPSFGPRQRIVPISSY